jgi:hypothetical protein
MSKVDLPLNRADDMRPKPTAWEMFLLSAGVPESNCAPLLKGRTQVAGAVRSWVYENYSKRYVPEFILDALGLRKRLKLRWQDND